MNQSLSLTDQIVRQQEQIETLTKEIDKWKSEGSRLILEIGSLITRAELAEDKVRRLRAALVGILPFAYCYHSHQLRNVNDKLEERLEAAKLAISETEEAK